MEKSLMVSFITSWPITQRKSKNTQPAKLMMVCHLYLTGIHPTTDTVYKPIDDDNMDKVVLEIFLRSRILRPLLINLERVGYWWEADGIPVEVGGNKDRMPTAS
jgi:hypothetical protein